MQPDADRVAAASAFIRERLKAADAGLLAIGHYVLDEFFGGDPATYAARARKDASLRALLRRADTAELPISKTGLSNALGLAVVTRQLGADSAFSQLPQSLGIVLLPLRDPQLIETLAVDVLAWPDMTVRELRKIVREKNPRPATGRPPKSPLSKAVAALVRVLDDGRSGRPELGADDVAALSPEEREQARVALGYVRDRVTTLRQLLGVVSDPSSDVGTARSTETDVEDPGGASAATDRRLRLALLLSAT